MAGFISGCLIIEKVVIKYNVKENLEGSLQVYYYGITSDNAAEEDKIKEMEEFYDEYLSYADAHAKAFSLHTCSAQLINKIPLKCDAILNGEFHNFVQSIVGMMPSKANFSIQNLGDTLTFKAWSEGTISIEDKEDVIEITYLGKILSNNADFFDEANGIMRWSSKSKRRDGISLSLKFKEV